MRKQIMLILLGFFLISTPAYADAYRFDGVSAGIFGIPTSDDTVYVTTEDAVNIDRSKNAALIPPSFGSATSYVLNSGEYLTPNLIVDSKTATAAGLVQTGVTVMPPAVSNGNSGSFSSINSDNAVYYAENNYTEVTSDLYYAGGHLGTLNIPAINLSVKVYQGTDNATLKKGVGHFESTSIWNGNVALAGHNRGTANYFGKIYTLSEGDKITLTTKLGTRSYRVYSVDKINKEDVSVLEISRENVITLVSCVMNQPNYRWCVQAIEV